MKLVGQEISPLLVPRYNMKLDSTWMKNHSNLDMKSMLGSFSPFSFVSLKYECWFL